MSWRWILCGLAGAAAVGCARPADSSRYVPGPSEARAALAAGLDDWRETDPPYPPSRELKGVVFADKQRQPDDRLSSFAIVGESEVENARQFTVRLQIAGQDAPRLVRYNVLGRDPIWVFRLEDYEMISHWEHPMPDDAAGPTAPAAAPAGGERTDPTPSRAAHVHAGPDHPPQSGDPGAGPPKRGE